MVDKDRSTSWAPFLFAFLAFGGVGGGLFFLKPFETSRHSEPTVSTSSPISGYEAVPARIWQDPFSAIERYQRANKTNGDDNSNRKNNEVVNKYPRWPDKSKKEQLIIMPVMVYGGYYSENIEDRRRRRYAVLSAMAQNHYRPDDVENIRYFKFPSKDRNNSFIVPYEWVQYENIGAHNDTTSRSLLPPCYYYG